MKLLPLKIQHYKNISLLANNLNWKIYDFETWKNLWEKNPSIKKKNWEKGSIIVDKKNKVLACLASFPVDYFYNKKIITASVLTTWIVNKKAKIKSILMHQKYFHNSKADFFLNTSSNVKSKSVWLSLGGQEVKGDNFNRFFLPLNFDIFYKKIINKRNIFFFNFFFFIINSLYSFYVLIKFFKKKSILHKNFILSQNRIFDKKFDTYFYSNLSKKVKNKLYLKKDSVFLNWHFAYQIKNKSIKIFTLLNKNKEMCGYVIGVLKKNRKEKYYKFSIVDYDFTTKKKIISEVFKEIFLSLKNENKIAFIEFISFDSKYNAIFKSSGFLNYNSHNPFLFKLSTTLSKKIILKTKPFSSFKMIDGDAIM